MLTWVLLLLCMSVGSARLPMATLAMPLVPAMSASKAVELSSLMDKFLCWLVVVGLLQYAAHGHCVLCRLHP
jgi:hypothetical protein